MDVLTTGETAKALSLERYQLEYLVKIGEIIPPRKTVFGRRCYYTGEDLNRMREVVEKRRVANNN